MSVTPAEASLHAIDKGLLAEFDRACVDLMRSSS